VNECLIRTEGAKGSDEENCIMLVFIKPLPEQKSKAQPKPKPKEPVNELPNY